MFDFLDILQTFIENHTPVARYAGIITCAVGFLGIAVVSWLTGIFFQILILGWVKKIIAKSKTAWDDLLVKWKVLDKIFMLIPAFVFYALSKHLLNSHPTMEGFLTNISAVYIICIAVCILDSMLDLLLDVYRKHAFSQAFPIKSFVQVIKVVVYVIGAVLIISILAGKSPVYILGGMGALTAVLLLVFKDTILGFVAGIQLSRNKMVQIGDWIEMPKYGADGNVIDLALTTVKVQNFDNTVTTVPTYALISDSFKNWRYMSSSGGRRIMRSLFVDMNSVEFCSEEMLQRFSKVEYIADYIVEKQNEILKFNQENKVDLESLANGRRMTNLGVLRAYMEAYLQNNPMISKELTLIVRLLEPTAEGLPIQIYCFCIDKVWVNYEGIQSDIYDHFIAVLPVFDLRIYQRPSGYDFSKKFVS